MNKKIINTLLVLCMMTISVKGFADEAEDDDDAPAARASVTPPPAAVAATPPAAANSAKPEIIVSAFDAKGDPLVNVNSFDLRDVKLHGPYSLESLPADVRDQIIGSLPSEDQNFLTSSAFSSRTPSPSEDSFRARPILNVQFKEADSKIVELLRKAIQSRSSRRTVDPVTGQPVRNPEGFNVGGSDSDQSVGYRITGRLGRDRYTDMVTGERHTGYRAGFFFKCKFNTIAECFRPRD